MNLKDIQKWTIPGLYALIDHSQRKVDIRYSNNIMKSLVNVLSIPEPYLRPHLDSLEFQFLEECSDVSLQKIRQGFHLKQYEAIGYSAFSKKKIVHLKPVLQDIQVRNRLYFAVYIKYTNNKKILVGLFGNKFQADEFFDKYYRLFDGTSVVYSINELTGWYYKELLRDKWSNPLTLL